MIRFHLVSNAHIDPVWQWRIDEGIGTAISTFLAAADFCEEYDNYVFCHNEAILYKWIEKFSPGLFERIRKLVHLKKWHIAGGWYLQSDCNIPSGEGLIRQIIEGLGYFSEKFGSDFVRPTTVTNYDCPGNSPGMYQILNDLGYDSLIYIRGADAPDKRGFYLEGPNGKVLTYRSFEGYCTLKGKADERIEFVLNELKDQPLQMCLWGVGNHGGGATRKDLAQIEKLKDKYPNVKFMHSVPEAFFEDLKKEKDLKIFTDNGTANEGTYSSEYEVKRLYNRLENEYFTTERMAAFCFMAGKPYPADKLKSAELDMLEVQFHDSVTGTSIREVEDDLFTRLRHGLAEADDIRIENLFFMLKGESRAKEGEYPVFIINPHPYTVSAEAECEIMLDDQGWDIENPKYPLLYDCEKQIPVQLIRESSDVPLDWRKKIAFNVTVEPFSVKRYSCYFKRDKSLKPAVCETGDENYIYLKGKNSVFGINRQTGLVDSYKIGKTEYLKNGSAKINIIENICDPWGFEFNKYKKKIGEFTLMNGKESSEFIKVGKEIPAGVKIIEDGPIKTAAECYFIHGFSRARVTYTVYKNDDVLDIKIDLYNAEKDCKVKIAFNGAQENAVAEGKSMFCRYALKNNGDECAVQDYVLMSNGEHALSVMTFGTYGADFKEGTLSCTMLSGCAYSAEPILDWQVLPDDRFTYRMDQGERNFRFVLFGGHATDLKRDVERKSLYLRQPLQTINFFPVGEQKTVFPKVSLSHPAAVMECMKVEPDGAVTVRICNSSDNDIVTGMVFTAYGVNKEVSLKPYQFRTFRISGNAAEETNAMGEKKN